MAQMRISATVLNGPIAMVMDLEIILPLLPTETIVQQFQEPQPKTEMVVLTLIRMVGPIRMEYGQQQIMQMPSSTNLLSGEILTVTDTVIMLQE